MVVSNCCCVPGGRAWECGSEAARKTRRINGEGIERIVERAEVTGGLARDRGFCLVEMGLMLLKSGGV